MTPGNVIYQTAEDGLSDTIKPRLVAAGAACDRVLVIDDSDRALTLEDDRLEQAIVQTHARLVVLGPDSRATSGAGGGYAPRQRDQTVDAQGRCPG